MKTKIKNIFLVIICLAVYQLICPIPYAQSNTEQELLEVLQETANEMNKNCPKMIDKVTRLDNAVSGPGKIVTYNITLISHAREEINVKPIKTHMTKIFTNKMNTSPDMKIFRENKVTVIYNYKDKNGRSLMSIKITP